MNHNEGHWLERPVLEQLNDRLFRAEQALEAETRLSNAYAKALQEHGFEAVWDPQTRSLTVSQEPSASSHWACDLCDRLWPKRANSIGDEEGWSHDAVASACPACNVRILKEQAKVNASRLGEARAQAKKSNVAELRKTRDLLREALDVAHDYAAKLEAENDLLERRAIFAERSTTFVQHKEALSRAEAAEAQLVEAQKLLATRVEARSLDRAMQALQRIEYICSQVEFDARNSPKLYRHRLVLIDMVNQIRAANTMQANNHG